MATIFIDVFLAVYFTIIGVHYTATTIGLKHRDGRTRVHYGRFGSRTWIIRWVFYTFRLAILLFMVGRLFDPQLDAIILPLTLPFELYVRSLGALMMLVGFFFISYTHAYMAGQWQSGLSTDDFKLLEHGPYSRCRHPIFSAVMLGMLGFALALPSLFTLVCLIAGVLAVTRQATEEEHLLAKRADYQAYLKRTAKWPLGARVGDNS
jgi:protein-S-isoprenylcysteine O-methyltransferase Ste14